MLTGQIALQDAKDHLRVTHDDEDALILGLLDASYEYVSKYIGRPVRLERKEFVRYAGSYRLIILPGPILEVQSVVIDNAGITSFTFENASFSEPRIRFTELVRADTQILVKYFTGMRPVPADIRAAILLQTANLYENRSGAVIGTISSELPHGVKAILDHHRRF